MAYLQEGQQLTGSDVFMFGVLLSPKYGLRITGFLEFFRRREL
jgi:hypothetical protein